MSRRRHPAAGQCRAHRRAARRARCRRRTTCAAGSSARWRCGAHGVDADQDEVAAAAGAILPAGGEPASGCRPAARRATTTGSISSAATTGDHGHVGARAGACDDRLSATGALEVTPVAGAVHGGSVCELIGRPTGRDAALVANIATGAALGHAPDRRAAARASFAGRRRPGAARRLGRRATSSCSAGLLRAPAGSMVIVRDTYGSAGPGRPSRAADRDGLRGALEGRGMLFVCRGGSTRARRLRHLGCGTTARRTRRRRGTGWRPPQARRRRRSVLDGWKAPASASSGSSCPTCTAPAAAKMVPIERASGYAESRAEHVRRRCRARLPLGRGRRDAVPRGGRVRRPAADPRPGDRRAWCRGPTPRPAGSATPQWAGRLAARGAAAAGVRAAAGARPRRWATSADRLRARVLPARRRPPPAVPAATTSSTSPGTPTCPSSRSWSSS